MFSALMVTAALSFFFIFRQYFFPFAFLLGLRAGKRRNEVVARCRLKTISSRRASQFAGFLFQLAHAHAYAHAKCWAAMHSTTKPHKYRISW